MPSKRNGDPYKINKIKVGKKKVVLFFPYEAIEVSHNVFTDFKLYEGKTLSEKEFKALKKASSLDASISYAYRLLSNGLYTVHEIYQKLEKKSLEEKDIKFIIGKLIGDGLLDDEEYAKNYIEDANNYKYIGKDRIIFDLKKKGIPDRIISSLSFPYKKEKEKCLVRLEAIDKRNINYPYRKRKEKARASLLNYGFENDVINECLVKITDKNPINERKNLKNEYKKAYIRFSRKYEGYNLKEKIIASLLRKGYEYEDIKALMEDK